VLLCKKNDELVACQHCAIKKKSNLALRLAAKKAPDICRAFSVCFRCCFDDFTFPLTGTGFPSVRSFRACHDVRTAMQRMIWRQVRDLGLAADFFLLGLCCSLGVHAGDAIF
jgi:hypothetical protein